MKIILILKDTSVRHDGRIFIADVNHHSYECFWAAWSMFSMSVTKELVCFQVTIKAHFQFKML